MAPICLECSIICRLEGPSNNAFQAHTVLSILVAASSVRRFLCVFDGPARASSKEMRHCLQMRNALLVSSHLDLSN